MAATITRQDPRYASLYRGRNARFPARPSDSVSRIEICENALDAAGALQRVVNAGLRPTIRSGGHCYEDFVVNNPDGAILDLSLLNHTSSAPGGKPPYQVGPGAVLGAVYLELYKKYNLTIPGGSCYSVASGGHLSGGGYGLLTRLQGLSVDWITAVDILTVEANGKVVNRHIDKSHDADLFRAVRGAGASSFGVITNFYFEELPPAPQNLSAAGMSFAWDTMTEDKFIHIAQTYGAYFETRGQEPDTWPLFTFLELSHKAPGHRIGVTAAIHDMDGRNDLQIATEFLDLFLKCGEADSLPDPDISAHHLQFQNQRTPQEPSPCIAGKHLFSTRPWIDATIATGGGIGTSAMVRAKYKSCYMKRNFTKEELRRMYKHLTRDLDGMNPGGVISVDSYGGAANKISMAGVTSVPQRSSIMKLQFQMYWQNPEEDEARLKYYDEMYTDIYSANVDAKYGGTPFHNDLYEGCYINYPDADMVKYPFWPELYYGTGGLYPFLQRVKKKYDPNNIFHHSMAVRV